jgi:adenylate kinase family enzyme
MIVGTPGSGKSTLARELGARLGLPVVHMDREVHWLPGWVERDRAEKLPIVERIIARDAWVFEGGHSDSYSQRLARAQMLIWTDAPLPLRLWRVTRRAITGLGRTRPDLADDCPERLRGLPEFWRYMLTSNRRSATRLRALFDAADIPKHHLRSLRAIDTFLEEI